MNITVVMDVTIGVAKMPNVFGVNLLTIRTVKG
jgi:hypothetical protein